jgi:glycine/D-amino acid oxidase-like deaminating enzyme
VAAGLINPVTGRWMTKSWNFDQLGPSAEATYRAIEAATGCRIYHPIPAIRYCQNDEDLKRAGRRLRNPRYGDVLGPLHAPGTRGDLFHDAHGSFSIQKAAYVDLPQLVHKLREIFAREGCYEDARFDHAALHPHAPAWRYGDLRAERVIFCEGAAALQNPWFAGLALAPVKGETLLCRAPGLALPPQLFHHRKWLLGYPDGSFRIGASYDEQDLSPHPTQAQCEALLADARAALKGNPAIEVQDQLAGLRPSAEDNRPLIGPHPHHRGLYLFNGLGSKGASVAPLMSQILAEHLLHGRSIDAELGLARFKQST